MPHPTRAAPPAPFHTPSIPIPPTAALTATPDPRTAGSPLAAELNAPGGDALHDVRALNAMIRQYLRILHNRQGLPIGDDIDLGRVLTGHNPMHFVLIPPGHPALGADGHLRDRWGTHYFIHPLGYGSFEVRSAGPDRKLFTADDLVDTPASPAPAP